MSDFIMSALISAGILAAMFVFVPMLEICGPHCQRLLGRNKLAKQPAESDSLQEAA